MGPSDQFVALHTLDDAIVRCLVALADWVRLKRRINAEHKSRRKEETLLDQSHDQKKNPDPSNICRAET